MKLVLWLGTPLVLIAGLIVFWDWDWFIPLVDARASAVIGRTVHIGHLHLRLGRVIRVTADNVTIDNPPGWAGPPFGTAEHLTADVNIWEYLRTDQLIIPLIDLRQARANLVQTPNGRNNYELKLAGSWFARNGTKIGDLRIEGSQIRAELARLKAALGIDIATRGDGDQAQIVADARGTYAGVPIESHMIGGPLLSLRDANRAWPIQLELRTGQTTISLAGTLQDPLQSNGADIKLQLAGQVVAQPKPLTGMPIPETPPFRMTGQLGFARSKVQLHDIIAQVGSSDLQGSIEVVTETERPVAIANLQSRAVDLTDMSGFLGAGLGYKKSPDKAAASPQQAQKAEAGKNLLPQTPISIPQLHWADIHLRYRGQQIKGRSVSLDNVTLEMDLVDGVISVHPVSFGVGTGSISANAVLTPFQDMSLRAKADLQFKQVDVSRLVTATHVFQGAGTLSGSGNLDATGNSVAQLLGNGNGNLHLGMAGGDLSASLVNLSGLQFGNALLSALGLPQRTKVECLVNHMALRNGQVTIEALTVDTGEAIINGKGSISLKTEEIDLRIDTEAKHFSIGSLPSPINISGTLSSPSIRPGAELAARGGAAAGLAVLFPPLALLPTIQLGVGDDHRCQHLLARAKQQPEGENLPSPRKQPGP